MSGDFPDLCLQVPHLQQPRDGDCLPACAYMALTYLNKQVRYWRLRWALRTKAFGTPFPNIRKLEPLGITVEAQARGTFGVLYSHLQENHPCIVSVQTKGLPGWSYNALHAVVLVGIDGSNVLLNDPAFPTAPVTVPLGEFDLAWLAQDEWYAVLLP